MDLRELFLSPFERRYCNWFYVMMCFNLVLVFSSGLSFLMSMMKKGGKERMMGHFVYIIVALLSYINSRMWYSMCLR